MSGRGEGGEGSGMGYVNREVIREVIIHLEVIVKMQNKVGVR